MKPTLTILLFLVATSCAQAALTPASLSSTSPSGVVRGGTVTLTLNGSNLAGANAVFFDDEAINAKIVSDGKANNQIKLAATLGPTTRLGIHRVFAQTLRGTTGAVTFAVGDWPQVSKQATCNSLASAQHVTPPCTVVGALTAPGEADYFAFEAKAGQELVFEVVASQIRSRLNSVLTLLDAEGHVLTENNDYDNRPDSLLGYRFENDGTYVVRIRDFENQSGSDVSYRLNIGEFPLVTSVFPLGLQKGTAAEFTLTGLNLRQKTLRVESSATTGGRSEGQHSLKTIELPAESLRPVRVAVGEQREAVTGAASSQLASAQRVDMPVAINGRLTSPSAYFRFAAKKNRPFIIEVQARRLGSPLDSVIEVTDLQGKLIERATLRPVAETALTLSDRDSVSIGLRLLSWADLAMNDYVFCGGEIMQVVQLPLGPDEDVKLRSFRGQRVTFLDTTPVAHAVNAPVYKVQVHPPGKTFGPNGMPLFTVYYRNDDGGPLYGKDSRLTFTPPSDGEYLLRLSDARGQCSERHAYRLIIRDPQPDFRLTMAPEHPNVPQGGNVALTFTADRLDGFDGDIKICLDDLPKGFYATEGLIPAGESTCSLVLYADDDAAMPTSKLAFRVTGSAAIGSAQVARALDADRGVRLLTVLPKPDLIVAIDRRQVAIQPGKQVTLTAKIERRNGFAGRVPVDVRNLPHGVRVLDVGLNGVLINEQQTSRQFVIYCEPWVKPMAWTFYVGGVVEGGLTSFAEPVTLLVSDTKTTAAGVSNPSAKK